MDKAEQREFVNKLYAHALAVGISDSTPRARFRPDEKLGFSAPIAPRRLAPRRPASSQRVHEVYLPSELAPSPPKPRADQPEFQALRSPRLALLNGRRLEVKRAVEPAISPAAAAARDAEHEKRRLRKLEHALFKTPYLIGQCWSLLQSRALS
jgi:hypothetical protein